MRYRDLRGALAASVAIYAVAVATPAMAQTKSFDVPAQSAATGIPELATQADVQILVSEEAVRGKTIRAIKGSMTVDQAIRRVAADAGLRIVSSDGRTWALAPATSVDAAPSSASGSEIYSANEIVVTAQKKAQSVQDVPLAVTALSGDQLQAQKVEGGFDLLRAVPNVTFSKSNFTGYNFSIRGVGTKAVSPTTDPGVAVEFNGTPLIRNRLFEQEYFDIERVEVLRGPQGTLHGRNATSGVINVISNKPDLNDFDAMVKLEAGNYRAQRAVGMINVPIVSDVLALRAAGSVTKRDGFGLNLYDNSDADDRNLWSSRVTLGFQPSSRIRADLVWEHFEENDRRQRTSKQLCTHDAGPTHIGNTEIVEAGPIAGSLALLRGTFSQGCLPGSLYDDAAYGVPNGFSIPFIAALAHPNGGLIGFSTNSNTTQKPVGAILTGVDPYGGTDVRQSKDLRSFYSQIPTTYRANTDVFELNVSVDVTDALTFTSQSAYVTDDYYASQDYNRFTTVDPVFADTSKLWGFGNNNSDLTSRDLLANGVFCDPQVGCASSVVGQDVSRANSKQWSQEFLLRSDFDGPLNFSIGANYLKYKTVEDYFLFHNGITLASVVSINRAALGGSTDLNRSTTNPDCSYIGGSAAIFGQFLCVPIDQRSIAEITDGRSLDDAGHNFFVSRNPYKLTSHSAFGELYWKPTENLGLTFGLRYTDDKKTFRVIPSQTALTPRDFIGLQNLPPFLPLPTRNALGASNFIGTGFGYPEDTPVVTGWKKMSGRFSFDWKPHVSFTDDTLIYGSFSRGYKAGGMNPPPIGFVYEEAEALGYFFPYSKVDIFKPEFVNAFEIGTKNILMGGRLTLNAGAFYYDYKDYQVSQIRDRTAVNENFDAEIWGLEFESVFSPTPSLRFNASVGYLKTRIGKGEKSIDIMNRTAGHDDWVVFKSSLTRSSNCIMPTWVAEDIMSAFTWQPTVNYACPGGGGFAANNYAGIGFFGNALPSGRFYNPMDYPEANFGQGFDTDLSGNELPNSPRWTVSFGAQYTQELTPDWSATIRGDGYWQAKSWHRVYNLAPYDRLRDWTNFNISLRIDGPENFSLEAYVKNVFNSTPITDAFLNSDDSGLTTNVFTLDPRIIGFSIAKKF